MDAQLHLGSCGIARVTTQIAPSSLVHARSRPKMSHLSQNHDQSLPTLDGEAPLNSTIPGGPACCSLRSLITPVLVLVTLVSICTAAYFAGKSRGTQASDGNQWINNLPLNDNLPLIDATAAVTSEKYSMATGQISEDAEGLFVLDHNSGLLQCSVIYPRSGKFLARFTTNVADALGTGGKGGKYMMVSGHAGFPRASNRPAASTILYVMDTATGNYACYGIPFDQTAVPRNNPQQGLMVLIHTGAANPVIDRDKLR